MGVFEYGYNEFLDGQVISSISVSIRNRMSILLLMSNIDSVSFNGLSSLIMYICKFSNSNVDPFSNSNVDPLCSGVNGVRIFFSLSGLSLLI